jgi:hypothetical protein
MLVNVYGLRPGRATRDIDFGIAVESWEQFQGLKARMIATGEFAGDSKAQQRLIYTDRADGFSIPVDLIPFRGVAPADKMIAWPPARDVALNVAGFEEAWASPLPVEVEDGFTVRVASVPGLTAAQADRVGGPWRTKTTRTPPISIVFSQRTRMPAISIASSIKSWHCSKRLSSISSSRA